MLARLFSVDIPTVMLALCLGNLASAGLLAVYSDGIGRLRAGPERLFALSKLLQGLAWPLLVLREQLPDLVSYGLGNALLLTGFWLDTECVRALDQPTRPVPGVARALALAAACGAAATWLMPWAHRRIALSCAVGVLLFALSGLRLLRGPRPLAPLRKTLGLAYAALCATILWRGLLALAEPDLTLFSSGLATSLSYLPLFLLMIAGSFGLLLLFKDRDDRLLTRMATHDELTGAPNRRALLDMADMLAARSRREARPLAVLMLDIDHFKLVNDNYGHAVGDAVLRDLTAVIRKELRAYDAFGRFGGEEFVAVLPDAGREDALGVAERIRAAVAASRPAGAPGVRYTVSIGVAWESPGAAAAAIAPGVAETDRKGGLDTLLSLADQAMYVAKGAGRNRVCAAAAPHAPEDSGHA